MAGYARPESLVEALSILASGGDWQPLAGGTDIFPGHADKPVRANLLDLSGIEALHGISRTGMTWRFGAAATWSAIIDHPLPAAFDGLKQAAKQVGGRQIQNAATLGGNVCNASPAADGVAVLMAMDAEVELTSRTGVRCEPLDRFVIGNRKTIRRSDELLTAIHVKTASRSTSHFLKLGSRKYLVISIVMVAVILVLDEQGFIEHAAVSVGACAPVAVRLTGLEQGLCGERCREGLGAIVEREHLSELSPIDDIRGTAVFRNDVTEVLVKRCLMAASQKARQV